MSKKMTLRVDDALYAQLHSEYLRFGYRSFNAYICRLLKMRNVVEVTGGSDLAAVLHQIRTMDLKDSSLWDRRKKLCQSYDLLMVQIEKLRKIGRAHV